MLLKEFVEKARDAGISYLHLDTAGKTANVTAWVRSPVNKPVSARDPDPVSALEACLRKAVAIASEDDLFGDLM